MTPQGRRLAPAVPFVEGAVTACAGGALGAFAGTLVGWPVIGAAIGGLNGAVSGWRGIYAWRRPSRWPAFVLDSTWALPMTASALVAHAVALATADRGGYVAELSRRQDRHVYAGGLRIRRGFVITTGNTINSAGEAVRTSDRRRRLVTDHEDVHVWQARWLGPAYPILYVGWSVLGALAGLSVWALRRRGEPVSRVVDTCAYYLNPLEWWAYSRDGVWPPAGVVRGLGWRRAVVRPFHATRRAEGRGAGSVTLDERTRSSAGGRR